MEEAEIYQQGVEYVSTLFETGGAYLSWQLFSQLVWLSLAMILAKFLAQYVRKRLRTYVEESPLSSRWLIRPVIVIRRAVFPITVIVSLFVYILLSNALGFTNTFSYIMMKLFIAWLLIGIVTSFIRSRRIFRITTTALWAIAALQILGYWDPFIGALNEFEYTVGDTSISLLGVIKGALSIGVFLWVANLMAKSAERFIRQIDDLTPSVKVLLSKLTKIILFTIAAFMGMNIIGLDLTTLTVFSGAAGLGLGFGLQKVFSNYISGIILLLDRSIKPGDVIAIDDLGTYGWVQSLGSRYVSIITRDGKEHLVPNELLITDKVENWSHSDNNVRIHVPVGISYDSDLDKALELMEEAVNEEPRVIQPPKPNVLIIEFGDSSVDLEARCWIRDPVNGIQTVRSSIYKRIWHKFRDNGIQIPYPQHDYHIKSISPEVLDELKQVMAGAVIKNKKAPSSDDA